MSLCKLFTLTVKFFCWYGVACSLCVGPPLQYRPGPPIRSLYWNYRNIGHRDIYSAEKEVTTNHDLSLTKTTHRKQITLFTIDSSCLPISQTFTNEKSWERKKSEEKSPTYPSCPTIYSQEIHLLWLAILIDRWPSWLFPAVVLVVGEKKRGGGVVRNDYLT